AALEQTELAQVVQIDQQWVSGARRRARIRRVAGADRSDRQHLPPALTSFGEKFEKAVRLAAEIAHTKRAWQRARMQQDAAAALGGRLEPAGGRRSFNHRAPTPSRFGSAARRRQWRGPAHPR